MRVFSRCDKTSGGLDIIISEKGSAADNRPPSKLRIGNLDPENGRCTVTVVPIELSPFENEWARLQRKPAAPEPGRA